MENQRTRSDTLLSHPAAAKRCGIARSTWYRWWARGATPKPVIHRGRIVRFAASDIDAFAQKLKGGVSPPEAEPALPAWCTLLPYCLDLKSGNTWIALNRRYKPVGFSTGGRVSYEDYPLGFEVSSKTLKALGHKEGATRVYLYDDESVPLAGTPDFLAYAKKIELLIST